MNIQESSTLRINLSGTTRIILLVVAVLAALGPNVLYLHAVFTDWSLQEAANENPVAMAFMIEAMMLLALFLWYVYRVTSSWLKVVLYLAAAFAGSLAFSFPLFLYLESGKASD